MKLRRQLSGKPRAAWILPLALGVLPVFAFGAQPKGQDAPGAVDAVNVPAPAATAPELDGRTVYQILLGEIAMKRGDGEVAAQAYFEVAQRSRDPAVLSRGMQVAAGAQRYDLALEFGRIWVEVEPKSVTARHALVGVLAALGQGDEMVGHLKEWLSLDDAQRARNVLHLTRLFSGMANRTAVLAAQQEILSPYLEMPESHYVLANTARLMGDKALALSEIREARRLKPDWAQAVVFEAQVLNQDAPDEAIAALSGFLANFYQQEDALIYRGRLLAIAKRYAEARVDLETALANNPGLLDALYPYALVLLQLRDLDAAEKALNQLAARDIGGRDFVEFQLGVLAEDRGDLARAKQQFARVGQGDYFITAQARLAQVTARQGNVAEAQAQLQRLQASSLALSDADRARLIIAEAQILRDAKQFEAAFAALAKGLQAQPDEPDLLYDQAMVAERLNRNDVVELNLNRVIVLKPGNAHAYNALGYSLAERNIRLDEARALIVKALSLAPDDPFILDSMGWVLFRLGQPKEALAHLERAYKIRPDPEIAAHIGEVLWSLGQHDAARTVWRDAQKKYPESEVLSAVIKKFIP